MPFFSPEAKDLLTLFGDLREEPLEREAFAFPAESTRLLPARRIKTAWGIKLRVLRRAFCERKRRFSGFLPYFKNAACKTHLFLLYCSYRKRPRGASEPCGGRTLLFTGEKGVNMLKYGMVGGGKGAFIGEVHRKAMALDHRTEPVSYTHLGINRKISQIH